MATDAQLYDEAFTVTSITSGKYDRVSRIHCTSLQADTSMTLDINHELYPCAVNDTLQVVLADTLNLDGTKDDGKGWKDWSRSKDSSLADMYDYVCRGKIYKFEQSGNEDNMYVNWDKDSRLLSKIVEDYAMLMECVEKYTFHLEACLCISMGPSRN